MCKYWWTGSHSALGKWAQGRFSAEVTWEQRPGRAHNEGKKSKGNFLIRTWRGGMQRSQRSRHPLWPQAYL